MCLSFSALQKITSIIGADTLRCFLAWAEWVRCCFNSLSVTIHICMFKPRKQITKSFIMFLTVFFYFWNDSDIKWWKMQNSIWYGGGLGMNGNVASSITVRLNFKCRSIYLPYNIFVNFRFIQRARPVGLKSMMKQRILSPSATQYQTLGLVMICDQLFLYFAVRLVSLCIIGIVANITRIGSVVQFYFWLCIHLRSFDGLVCSFADSLNTVTPLVLLILIYVYLPAYTLHNRN